MERNQGICVMKTRQNAYIYIMRELGRILKTALAGVMVLALATAPALQAYQLGQVANCCSMSCCSGYGQNAVPTSEAGIIETCCCCHFSNREPATEIPLETQQRVESRPDTLAGVTGTSLDHQVAIAVFDENIKIGLPLAHGPPLYLLNSTYLI